MNHPLAAPVGVSELLRSYLEHFGIGTEQTVLVANEAERYAILRRVADAFSRIPYENLTKILKHEEEQDPGRARRSPTEVFADHVRYGAGGTCFSLTALLLHLTRALGFRAEPLLADRRYGENTHCALALWLDGRPHLLDPGFLITEPLPFDGMQSQRHATPFNEVVLVPDSGGERVELYTAQQGAETYRLSFKTAPVDAGEFLRAWDASFAWDMMRYPLLTQVADGRQLYLQGGRFQVRRQDAVTRDDVSADELAAHITNEFRVDSHLVGRALALLRRKGEVLGRR